MFTGKANILSLQQFPLILEYGYLPPIVVTNIGDAIDMRWYYRADILFHRHHVCQTKFKARQEFERLEKETVTVLKRAVMADIRGDPHTSQHLRRKARNLEKAKPPAFLAAFEDKSPLICKAYFDLLIGLDRELMELNVKLLKLSRDTKSDQHKLLNMKYLEKAARFEGIGEGMVLRLISEETWFEPLTEFFRRVDPEMMGCDSCFDPLNNVPHEWLVPTKIINCLHMEMLLFHWRHASFALREQPQFLEGTVQSDKLPRLQFDVHTSMVQVSRKAPNNSIEFCYIHTIFYMTWPLEKPRRKTS